MAKKERKPVLEAGLGRITYHETRNDSGIRESSKVKIDFGALPRPTTTESFLYAGISQTGELTPAIFRDDMRIRVKASVTLPVTPTATNIKLEKAVSTQETLTQKIARLSAQLNGEYEEADETDELDETTEAVDLQLPTFEVNIPKLTNPETLPVWAEVCNKQEEIDGVVYKYQVHQHNPLGAKKTKARKESRAVREINTANSALAFAERALASAIERQAFMAEHAKEIPSGSDGQTKRKK